MSDITIEDSVQIMILVPKDVNLFVLFDSFCHTNMSTCPEI
jgi:hypothetical protein